MTAAIRTASALALAVALGATLASCAPTPEPTPTQTAASPAPSPSVSSTGEPQTDDTPVTLTCDELVSPEVIYAYNPNTSFDENYVGAPDTGSALAVENGGVTCAWINQSSGDIFAVSVAQPSSEDLAEFKERASSGTPSVAWGGTFDSSDDASLAQSFAGPYWVVIEYDYLVEQGDVVPIMDSVLERLEA